MRKLRLYLTLWVAKTVSAALRALRRNGSHLPGFVALRVMPDVLAALPKPGRIIVVTGTNGKTTTTNLLVDALAHAGTPTVNNRTGSNTTAGVVSALVNGLTWGGRPKAQTAVLEMDERSARRILPGLGPSLLVCTNLTRDSIKRNAHPEYIAWIMTSAIPATTELILNGDDLIASGIGDGQVKHLFAVDHLPTDTTQPTGVARDVATCPRCDTLLTWDYWRFNHIGHPHCPACGFAPPPAEYRVTSVDQASGRLMLDLAGRSLTVHMVHEALVNVYNEIAVAAVLDRLGWTDDRISAVFEQLAVPSTRFNAQTVGDVTVVRQLTKGLVGVACSRAFEHIMSYDGPKALVMNIDEVTDIEADCENTCWTYDADYEFLAANDSLRQVVVGGVRRYDQAVRLAIAGVDPSIIVTVPGERDTADRVDLDGVSEVFNLHSVHNAISTGTYVQGRLVERLKGRAA